MDVVAIALAGLAAGLASGLLGIGGGVLFVPCLVIIFGEGQLEAEATSLLAMTLVAAVGAWRQHGYGNVELREAIALGVLATAGAFLGVVVANAVPERALEIGFAGLLFFVAWQLARRALRSEAT